VRAPHVEVPRAEQEADARHFEVRSAHLARGQQLRVRVVRLWGAETGPAAFEAEIRDAVGGEVLAAGRISCFTPPLTR
jgi:hypothetical protein